MSATGQLDRQFAGDGLVRLPNQVEALAIAPDGDTFAVGTVEDSLAMMEISPNGSFSPTFGRRHGLRLKTNLAAGALNESVDVLADNDNVEMLLAGTSIERVER